MFKWLLEWNNKECFLFVLFVFFIYKRKYPDVLYTRVYNSFSKKSMIPKIIHNIWIPGYHLLPEEIQKNHLLVKKKNPDWEFRIWDKDSIVKILKKYPDLWNLYKKMNHSLLLSPYLPEKEKTYESDLIQSYLAQYVILKEYGGIYYDIHLQCLFDFNALFYTKASEKKRKREDEMYLVKTSSRLSGTLYYLYPFFNTNDIDAQFMAFSKDHPIWQTVFKKIITLRNKDQISSIFDHIIVCHPEFSIQYLKKDGDCFTFTDFSIFDKYSNNNRLLKYYLSLFHCYYKQIYLLVILFISIFIIHNISVFNSQMFAFPSAVPIPGVPSSSTTQPPPKEKTNSNIISKRQSRRRRT
jgi:hypothetical protein